MAVTIVMMMIKKYVDVTRSARQGECGWDKYKER